jgi:hypothetical protein
MSSDIGKYTPLKTIVSYCMDANNMSEGDQDKIWLIGLRALVDLNQSIAAEPKTVRLPKNGNQTVTIPADCISWSKIGLLNADGEMVTLRINNGLTTFRDDNPNRLENLTPNINNSISALAGANIFLNYYYNNNYCNLFGLGNGLIQYGDCRVDEANQVIVLNPEFRYDNIMLEYISSPQKDDEYKVLTVLQEAIIAFIEWKLKLAPRELYYAAATVARRSLPGKKVTLQQINQVIRESQSMKLRS